MDTTQTQRQSSPALQWESLPGLAVIIGIGVLSWVLAQYMPRLGGVTIAILLGVLAGNLIPGMARFHSGAVIAEKRVLPIAIVLLGVELQLMTLVALGPMAAVMILASVGTSLGASVFLGRFWGYSREFSLLIGVGNGICGSSAIAATSHAVRADGKDIGISISVVNLLGTFGIFTLPAMVSLLSLGENQGGLLIGSTLQAVGQVVAAGFSVNETVGGVATVVKMGRVLMLGPVVILLTSIVSRRTDGQAAGGIRVPLFIVGFFVLSVIASLNIVPAAGIDVIKVVGKFLLIVAMVGIGMRIQLYALFRMGPGAFLFGLVVSTMQILVVLGLILLFGI